MPQRKQPRLGATPVVDPDRGRRRVSPAAPAAARPAPHRLWGLAGLTLVLAALALLWTFREPLGGMLLPESERVQLLEHATRALAGGELSREDGRGARELFLAVLALDPDHQQARQGLLDTGRAALLRAEAAAAAGDVEQAEADLALARQLDVPDAQTAPLQAILRRHGSSEEALAELLAEADAARQGLPPAQALEAALPAYDRALRMAPTNPVVRNARAGLVASVLGDAAADIAAGRIATAEAKIEQAADADPAHVDLPAVRAALSQARQAGDQREVGLRRQRLAEAEAALSGGDFVRAAELFGAIAQADEPVARRGVQRAVEGLVARALREAADFDFARAEASLLQLEAIAPGSPALRQARERVLQSRARAEGVSSGGAEIVGLQGLLTEFRVATSAGRMMEPPGESAWDLLRQLQQHAPDDVLRQAEDEFRQAARQCFESRLGRGRLSEAESCLHALETISPGDAGLGEASRRLASRWIGLAEERLGEAQVASARRAYDAARERDPHHPGLPALAARLERAPQG